jgi:hypothetical protein
MTQIDAAQVAVLADRVERMLADYGELRGMIIAQAATLVNLPVIQAQLTEHERKFERVFGAVNKHESRISLVEKATTVQAFTWRLTGAVLLCCVGLVGWGWKELERGKAADVALERRTMLIEYKLNIPPTTSSGDN